MKKTLRDVALIVLNYNTPNMTICAVKHVLNLMTGIRIIIVDNASTDDSVRLLKNEFKNEDTVFLVQSKKNGGYAKGNNLGLAFAKTLGDVEIVGIMNPDVVIGKEALYALVDILKEDKTIGLATTQTIYNGKKTDPSQSSWKRGGIVRWIIDGTLFGTFLRRFSKHILRKEINLKGLYKVEEFDQKVKQVFAVQGCLFFSRFSVFNRISGFDERTFLYCEEDILGEKIRAIGLRNVVLSDYWIEHNHQEKEASLKNIGKKLFHMRCGYESRCLYLREYAGYGCFVTEGIALIWKVDFAIRKQLVMVLCRD